MAWAVHVDDNIAFARSACFTWSLSSTGNRLGKTRRHQLPFTRMGMNCEVLGDRHLFIHRHASTECLKKIEIPFKLK
eukprot:7519587-Pyramimonas_sp.AAC.1